MTNTKKEVLAVSGFLIAVFFIFLIGSLTSCLHYVKTENFNGHGGGMPYLEEWPSYPLGKVNSEKSVRITNPLGQDVKVLVECRDNDLYYYLIKYRQSAYFKISVLTEDVYKTRCKIDGWNILDNQ